MGEGCNAVLIYRCQLIIYLFMSYDCQNMFQFRQRDKSSGAVQADCGGTNLILAKASKLLPKTTVSVALGMRNATFFTGEIRFVSCII